MIPRLSEPAEADLGDIWFGLATVSVQAADRAFELIWSAIDRLVEMPHLGHVRNDVPSRLLVWPVERWLILYEPLDGTIRIARIVRAGRDLSGLEPTEFA